MYFVYENVVKYHYSTRREVHTGTLPDRGSGRVVCEQQSGGLDRTGVFDSGTLAE